MDEENEYRKKALKIGGGLLGGALLASNWYATQSIAESCGYASSLGPYWLMGGLHIYPPYGYLLWKNDAMISQAIPSLLQSYEPWIFGSAMAASLLAYGITRNMRQQTSHGSARWATQKEIEKAGLGKYNIRKEKKKLWGFLPYEKTIKTKKTSGVVLGINPYTGKLMLHDGPEHLLLRAPTRSGKGVNTIIPTGLIWKNSIFFFDVKGELWQATAGYRRERMGQKVLKFEPLCRDGSASRWNPLAEINFRSDEEIADINLIVSVLVKPDGEKKNADPFWDNSASSLLRGAILHLLYLHYREGRPLPCLTDIVALLASSDLEDLFLSWLYGRHITQEEFLELEYTDKETGERKRHTNPLKEIYGEYVKDYKRFSEALGVEVKSLEDIRRVILASETPVDFDTIDDDDCPFHLLLTHPKVAECAANMLSTPEQTRGSIIATANAALNIYQDPIVQRNTSVSDFCIRDLLDPAQAVSLYLVMKARDMDTIKPISRLFINTMINKLIQDMKFEKEKSAQKEQRLLLMLDEFPQLGNLQKVETALAVCAGYGIKMCIVAQDANQLNKEYTKDNSISSNCMVQINFTPNFDSGMETANSISKALGKKTIATVSHSDGGGGFMKGSNSSSYTSRDLMSPDEVSHMDSEKEIVLVAGHRPIFGDKLRYHNHPVFMKRILPEPSYSDTVTRVLSYRDLFRIHAAEEADKREKRLHVAKAKENERTGQQNEESKEKAADRAPAPPKHPQAAGPA